VGDDSRFIREIYNYYIQANCVVHILRSNCPQIHVTGGKIKENLESTEGRRRRSAQLTIDLKGEKKEKKTGSTRSHSVDNSEVKGKVSQTHLVYWWGVNETTCFGLPGAIIRFTNI